MIEIVFLLVAQTELTQLRSGMSEPEASAVLEGSGAKLVHLAANEPQALRRALIEGGLLEIWNRFELTPKTADGELDVKAFERFVLAEKAGQKAVLAFGGKGLRAALGRYTVRVDATADPQGGWAPARLDPLKRMLKSLDAFDLSPLETDTYGNRFAWKGKTRDAAVRALFRPEHDELVVLVAAGS